MQRIRVMGFGEDEKQANSELEPDSLGGLADNVPTSSLCGELNPHGTRACAWCLACVLARLLVCWAVIVRHHEHGYGYGYGHSYSIGRDCSWVLILVLSSFHMYRLKRQRSDRLPRKATNERRKRHPAVPPLLLYAVCYMLYGS